VLPPAELPCSRTRIHCSLSTGYARSGRISRLVGWLGKHHEDQSVFFCCQREKPFGSCEYRPGFNGLTYIEVVSRAFFRCGTAGMQEIAPYRRRDFVSAHLECAVES
jgi:hypothetical protein